MLSFQSYRRYNLGKPQRNIQNCFGIRTYSPLTNSSFVTANSLAVTFNVPNKPDTLIASANIKCLKTQYGSELLPHKRSPTVTLAQMLATWISYVQFCSRYAAIPYSHSYRAQFADLRCHSSVTLSCSSWQSLCTSCTSRCYRTTPRRHSHRPALPMATWRPKWKNRGT
jgi:hypothetical protein